MPEFEQSIEIDAPVEQVFEFITTLENWSTTNPSITEVRSVDELDNGVQADITYRMIGIDIKGQLEVDVREPNKHVVNTFTGPGLKGVLEYHLASVDEGTRVVQHADYEFTGSVLDRVIEPVAAGYNRRQFDAVLTNTKEILEAQAKPET